ncbi:MAG: hypothetical protein KDA24_01240 [Deltaproteobacteria bacterium]|nr:hypothetical protein [Deltaproteobacteria bacterium]
MTRLAPLAWALLLALFLPSIASALPWWVEDDAEAERLAALLEALWPGHPVEVLLGEADFGREGISSDGATLTLVHDDRVRFSPTDGDLATQVALVRSWLRSTAVQESSWLPASERDDRPGPFAIVLVGGGARLPTAATTANGGFTLGPASPSGNVSVGGGFAWKHLRLGGRVSTSFGERAGVGSQAINLQRVFFGATASLVGQLGRVELQNTLGVGARLAVLRAEGGDAKPVTRTLPGLFVGVQLWGPLGDKVDFGGGLGASFDTASLAVRVGEEQETPLLLSPVTIYGELGVRFGCPCSGAARP